MDDKIEFKNRVLNGLAESMNAEWVRYISGVSSDGILLVVAVLISNLEVSKRYY